MFILKTLAVVSFMITLFRIDAKPTTDLTGKDLNTIIDELVDEYPRNKGKDSIGKTISKPFHDIAQGSKGWFSSILDGIKQTLGEFLEIVLTIVGLMIFIPVTIWLWQILRECKTKRDIRRLARERLIARMKIEEQMELKELTGKSEAIELNEHTENQEILSPV